MSKAVAYYRASMPSQKHSINTQKEIVRKYCSDNNIELVCEFEEIASGIEKTQKELKKALGLAENNNYPIICTTVDRLTRDYFLGEKIIRNYNTIFCCSPNMSLETKLELLSFAEKERQYISQRTKMTLASLKRNGIKLGNPNANFSYEQRIKSAIVRKQNADSNINNINASHKINELLDKTKNLTEIANILNENGFVTSRGFKFCANQVNRIIKRYELKK